jgi:hypothetical protein
MQWLILSMDYSTDATFDRDRARSVEMIYAPCQFLSCGFLKKRKMAPEIEILRQKKKT